MNSNQLKIAGGVEIALPPEASARVDNHFVAVQHLYVWPPGILWYTKLKG